MNKILHQIQSVNKQVNLQIKSGGGKKVDQSHNNRLKDTA